MEEAKDSSDATSAWRAQWPAAQKNPRVAAQIAREANGRGEHMLALSVAQGALRQLSLVSDPREATPLRQQMALALARSGSIEEAMEVLQDSVVVAPEDAETLGLMGRLHKDLADRTKNGVDAESHQLKALEFYTKGFAIGRNAYCGINAAVLSALTGDLPRARKMAGAVLELAPEEDRLWAVATVAMVRMIRGETERAREAFQLADRAGQLRRSDLAAVRREARRLAEALEGKAHAYEDCFGPATVAVFHGTDKKLAEGEQARLARWLQDNHVVCAWSAAASGEEAEFLERAATLGVETCAVLPESSPRQGLRKAVERASLLDFVAGGNEGADDLARRVATARATARAASWDVPLLSVATANPPALWRDLGLCPLVLRSEPEVGGKATLPDNRISAVLCVCPVNGTRERPPGTPDLRSVWENHAARCGDPNGNGGPYLFGWPSMTAAAQAAMELRQVLQSESAKASCTFVLHATESGANDVRLADWTRRVYPGRIHATGRFADLAALESGGGFDLCYVGTIDCQAEPLGVRLYHLRPADGGALRPRSPSSAVSSAPR